MEKDSINSIIFAFFLFSLIIFPMKGRLCILIVLFISFSISAVAPYNNRGERVVIDYPDDGTYSTLARALKEEVSLEWYEEYTSADSLLVSSTFSSLCDILPMENFVLSEGKNNAIGALSLTDGRYISFTFLDGKIHAMSFT